MAAKTGYEYQISGREIKEIRKKYGLSQQEFGARLGVTHAHISKIESDKEKPSETLSRLIRYEFNVDKLEGVPSSEMTKPKIKQYLTIFENLVGSPQISDGSLYNTEFLLAALVTIYRETSESGTYQEMLLGSISGIVDEVAQFIETTPGNESDKDAALLNGSKLSRTKGEIASCLENMYALLEERVCIRIQVT